MGTLVGVLPGLGPTVTIALLLPATFQLNPVNAIIMLSGISYGAMYGDSTTSILLNITFAERIEKTGGIVQYLSPSQFQSMIEKNKSTAMETAKREGLQGK
jgi:Tripartite tricarboxylate transporter TctA family